MKYLSPFFHSHFGGPHLAFLKAYSELCTRGTTPRGLRGPYRVQGSNPAHCHARQTPYPCPISPNTCSLPLACHRVEKIASWVFAPLWQCLLLFLWLESRSGPSQPQD